MVQGGVVIDMSMLNTIHGIATDRIVVDAGTTWSAVIDAALAQGLTPPVLTVFTELSVSGTLSVSGIGRHVAPVRSANGQCSGAQSRCR